MSRSNNLVFGRALETTSQVKRALVGADFSRRIYNPQIEMAGSPALITPSGRSPRPMHTRRSARYWEVSYETDIIRGSADGTAPAFFTELQAAGWTVGSGAAADEALFGADSDNSKSLSCELWDGLCVREAHGVRGNIEIKAAKPSDPLMLAFKGRGHGSESAQTADTWPSNISLDAVQGAILEACSLSIGDADTLELDSFSFRSEGDPVQIGNGAGGDDGFTEQFLSNQQFKLGITVWQHAKSVRDWLSYILDAAAGGALTHALDFQVPLGGSLALQLTGDLILINPPKRSEVSGVGTYPLEFQFTRNSDIKIAQIAAT